MQLTSLRLIRRLAELRERQAERLAEDRQAADDYIASVKEQVDRKIEAERSVDGKGLTFPA